MVTICPLFVSVQPGPGGLAHTTPAAHPGLSPLGGMFGFVSFLDSQV